MNRRAQALDDRLSSLGYVHVAESDLLFLSALVQALGFMPEDKIHLVIDFIAKRAGMAPEKIAADLDALDASLKDLLSVSDIILEEMRKVLLAYSISKRQDASLRELMEEIREYEVRRFMRLLPPREHVLLLYSGTGAKDALLKEFFGPAGGNVPKGIVTKSGFRYHSVDAMTYDAYGQKSWNEIVDTNLDWFVRCQPQKSNYVGRFAAEDHSWYIHHGFA